MLSIVAIGKNEGEHLARLAKSANKLVDYCDFPVETVFVDSASTDDSLKQARRHFDVVVELAESDRLCASAGRHVGTLEARYPWILYVDADMELREEFFPIVQGIADSGKSTVGYIGTYVHYFDDGSTAVQEFTGEFLKSELAAHFGGAVLLRKDKVMDAGNWNPGVWGKEEMNLYARLGDGDRVVRAVDVPMVNHYSEHYTRQELFIRLLHPDGGQGKVFYGFGQSIRALAQAGKLSAYFRLDSELTVYWLLLIVGLSLATALPFGLALLLGEIVMLSVWMGPGTVMRFTCLAIPLVSGWMKYDSGFEPKIKSRYNRQENK